MKTLYIVVEGPTEEEFVNNVLAEYLKGFNIMNAVPILLETSPGFTGGDIIFTRYRSNVEKLLISDPEAIVTSLIDYYELRTDFPGYSTAMALAYKPDSVRYLEEQLSNTIVSDRFIPYIQLHEFEGVLFSDIRGFNYMTSIRQTDRGKIQYIINHHPNPEMINDGKTTAPSVRLKSLIPRYRKPFHGPLIALENGIIPILQKCTRFKDWTEKIIYKFTQA